MSERIGSAQREARDSARRYKAQNLRYKRAALSRMSYEEIENDLYEIGTACNDIRYYCEADDGSETLLNALAGDDEEAYEFRMMFCDLSAQCEELHEAILGCGMEEVEFDDCIVALIGNRYRVIGWDSYEEDYFALTGYEAGLAATEAGKRLMRLTKEKMIAAIGQALGILVSFLDLQQKYDYLKATMDILRDENTSLLKQVKEIEDAYLEAEREGFDRYEAATKRLDRLLAALPDRAWIE